MAPSAYLNPHVPFTSKPWSYLCCHPWAPAFYAALDATPWRGWRPSMDQVAEAAAAEVSVLLERVAAEKRGCFDAAACRQQLVRLLQEQG